MRLLRPPLHYLRAGRRGAAAGRQAQRGRRGLRPGKLLNGLLRACEKRHISLERIERVADEIEGELRRESVQQVTSVEIGERALLHLRDLDRVAYIRFASVYRQFEDIEEFQSELARLDEPACEPTTTDAPVGPAGAGHIERGRGHDS